jgi:hypothetical protein
VNELEEGVNEHEALFFSTGRATNVTRKRSTSMVEGTQANQKAQSQPIMINSPECGKWLEDPAFIKEGAQRGARRYMQLREGGQKQEEQQELDQLGADLRAERWEQRRAMSEVAEMIGINPTNLCFLESGWATKDEYLHLIVPWLNALDLEISEYSQRYMVLNNTQEQEGV